MTMDAPPPVPSPTRVVVARRDRSLIAVAPAHTVTAAVAWADVARSRPLEDLALVPLLAQGTRAVFDRDAVAYADPETVDLVARSSDPAGWRGFLPPPEAARVPCQRGAVRAVADVLRAEDLPRLVACPAAICGPADRCAREIPPWLVVVVGRTPEATPDPADFAATVAWAVAVPETIVFLVVGADPAAGRPGDR